MDHADEFFKGHQDVVPTLRTRLQEFHAVLLTKEFGLVLGDLTRGFQIGLIAHQELGEIVRTGVIVELSHPTLGKTLKGLGIGNVIDENDALGLAKVRGQQDTREAFLAGRVPDLSLDLVPRRRGQHLSVKLNAHGGGDVMIQGPFRVGQSSHETRLAHSRIAQHDDLVQRRFGRRGAGHLVRV